jgi:putative membrane protein
VRLTLAWLHLVALGIGLGAVWMRASALRTRPLDRPALRRAFAADGAWGLAALIWLSTGLWRWFGEMEKSAGYYMRNSAFHAKLGLFLLILILELWPMITLIRWRRAVARSEKGGTAWSAPEDSAGRIAALSTAQAVIVLLMVLAAAAMARGYGAMEGGG